MEQITLNEIYLLCERLLKENKDLKNYPLYLGSDDELNNIHTCWFINELDTKDKSEDMEYLIDMINQDHHNIKINDKGVLLS